MLEMQWRREDNIMTSIAKAVHQQQVDVTLKLSLWLDASMSEDDITTYIRSSLPQAFGEELTALQNPVDILDIKQEAEIYGTASTEAIQPTREAHRERLFRLLVESQELPEYLRDYEVERMLQTRIGEIEAKIEGATS